MLSLTQQEVADLLPYLTAEEQRELAHLLGPRHIWEPLPGPQMQAFISEADELFYGGAAGGGKTDLLIGMALTSHKRSIIFRREYPQLKAIVDRSREIVGTRGKFNAHDNVWRLADGRILELGAVQYLDDVTKFQGRPHDLKAFDELPNFLERQYLFLSGWARTTVKGQRVRIVGAGNPPTSADGEWVIRRWGAWIDPQHPNPAQPGELRWYAYVEGKEIECETGNAFDWHGETIAPRSRTFIPAKLKDNPHLLNTGYAATLDALPEPLRSKLKGDFSAGIEDDPYQVIPTLWVKLAQDRWEKRPKPDMPMTALGVDVARGGRDKTVLAPRYGNWFGPLVKRPGSATPDGQSVATLVVATIERGAYANVDVIGVGSAAYDFLKGTITAQGINFGAGSQAFDKSGKLRLVNLRAEAYWKFREALDPVSGDDVALPPDPELSADLTSARWMLTTRGIQIESKEEIVKRLDRSPDVGDATVLAHYQGGAVSLLNHYLKLAEQLKEKKEEGE